MLPSQAINTRSRFARSFFAAAVLSGLTTCGLAGPLMAQSPADSNPRIRQPSPRVDMPVATPQGAPTPTSLQPEPTVSLTEEPPKLPRNLGVTTLSYSSPDHVAFVPTPSRMQLEWAPNSTDGHAVEPISYRTSTSIQPLEAPPGWNAVEKSIREKLESCDAMLRRGAVYSARQTCWKGLEELCQVLDLHDPSGQRVKSLRRALVAMQEEEDFYRYSDIQLAKSETLANLCFAHETPVIRNFLEQSETSPMGFNPLIAAQHYRSYAREQLVQACDHHPWGADLLYALGKAFEKQAWEDRSRSALIHQHAELVYQAALETNPQQTLAATQLGYVLLQLDRPHEAQIVLARSIQVGATQAGLQNLAEAYRRLNDGNAVQWCAMQIEHLKRLESSHQPEIPFTEIHPQQFAAISPPDATYLQGSAGGVQNMAAPSITAHPNAPQRIASQPVPQSTPEANGAKGWLPSLWR